MTMTNGCGHYSLFTEISRKNKKMRYYFRYPIKDKEFRSVSHRGRRGVYMGKPLHGVVTDSGHVDRSSPYNGKIAVGFLTEEGEAVLLFGEADPQLLLKPNGHRNWSVIHEAALAAIHSYLEAA